MIETIKTIISTIIVVMALGYVVLLRDMIADGDALNEQLRGCIPTDKSELVVLRFRNDELTCDRHKHYTASHV